MLREILIILASIVGFWLIFNVIIASILFRIGFARGKKPLKSAANDAFSLFGPLFEKEREYLDSLEKREVSVLSDDGLTLVADFVPAPNAVATLLFMHGYRGSANDFCFSARFFHESGFNLLLPDQRAHGRSEGRYICFGAKERFDCLKWVGLVTEKLAPDLPIILDGVSMGCTTVLLAAGLSLPQDVKAIVADCGFTTAWAELEHTIKTSFRLPSFPCMLIVNLFARIFAQIGLKSCDTVEAMKANDKIPVFFATGTRDRIVPPSMTEENYLACKAPKLLLVTEAIHGMSYVSAKDEYEKQLKDFLGACLKEID